MFTGIITGKGRVRSLQANDFGARLVIDPAGWPHAPVAGDSVAVNGVCLTHAPGSGDAAGMLVFDVIRQTLTLTNLGALAVGRAVNLEASMTADTPIAGHFVQGHVDAVGRVDAVDAGAEQWRMTVAVDAA
ncbi:MAG: riboflavin synthase, partial [Alphaproteobacteria bacterium]|nr:riboflavin synthase [Alphaproteobacteria bacterium]